LTTGYDEAVMNVREQTCAGARPNRPCMIFKNTAVCLPQHGQEVCFGLSADMDHNLTELQQQQTAKEFNSHISIPQSPFYSDTYRLTSDNVLRLHEGDQVVPSSQRRTVFGGIQKEAKPLPPLPDPEELMSDEAADNEVEFFTSDRRRLLPKSCPKAVPRGSNRDCGQVNHAYQESSFRAGSAEIASMAFSWPGREDRPSGRGGGFGASNWTPALHREDPHVVSPAGEPLCSKQPDHHQTSRFRFSFSGFALQPHGNAITFPTDKPQIPPRIPIPPKPPALSQTVNTNDGDRPPKIPPRVPLVPPCPPRTPSPKSLPIYINGMTSATLSLWAEVLHAASGAGAARDGNLMYALPPGPVEQFDFCQAFADHGGKEKSEEYAADQHVVVVVF
ncbi:hypothetical protein INR49_022354, partial [Caranx melampygus]